VLVVRELNLSTPLEPAITVGVALITAFFIHDLIVFPTGVRLAIGPDFSYREHLIFSWGTIRLRAGIELPIGVALVYCWLGSPALLFAAVIAYVSVWYMQQLAPQLQQLQETDELRARFFAMASHEVRTPLTSIAGFASTLRTQWDDLPESDRRRFVGIIDDQAERLARLTSNLLMLSRLEAGRLHVNPTNVAVHPAIQAAVSTAARPEDIAISCDSRLYAYADADHLRQLLDNYLTNAQRYGSAPISIDVTSDRAAGEIRVCVTDDGDGVPEAFRSQLFQAFTQADHPSGERLGAGLGLSIVQRLAEANAGRAWHEQPDEGGSRFCFALPLGASPLAASDTAPGSE
jgi:signal transduction histidine kinase